MNRAVMSVAGLLFFSGQHAKQTQQPSTLTVTDCPKHDPKSDEGCETLKPTGSINDGAVKPLVTQANPYQGYVGTNNTALPWAAQQAASATLSINAPSPENGVVLAYTTNDRFAEDPEATLEDPIRRGGRIYYTLILKDDWSCAPMSNWTPSGVTGGEVTAIQLVCVKAAPKDKK